jgi:hypothetical protein
MHDNKSVQLKDKLSNQNKWDAEAKDRQRSNAGDDPEIDDTT